MYRMGYISRFGSRQLRVLRCRRAHLPSTEMSTYSTLLRINAIFGFPCRRHHRSLNALDAGFLSGPRFPMV